MTDYIALIVREFGPQTVFIFVTVLVLTVLHVWDRYVAKTVDRLKMANDAQRTFEYFARRVVSDKQTTPHLRESIQIVSECVEDPEMAARFAAVVARARSHPFASSSRALEIRARLNEEVVALERIKPELLEDFRHAIMAGVSSICLRSPEATPWFVYALNTEYPISSVTGEGLAAFQVGASSGSSKLAHCS